MCEQNVQIAVSSVFVLISVDMYKTAQPNEGDCHLQSEKGKVEEEEEDISQNSHFMNLAKKVTMKSLQKKGTSGSRWRGMGICGAFAGGGAVKTNGGVGGGGGKKQQQCMNQKE